jgi:hypothetical protein
MTSDLGTEASILSVIPCEYYRLPSVVSWPKAKSAISNRTPNRGHPCKRRGRVALEVFREIILLR